MIGHVALDHVPPNCDVRIRIESGSVALAETVRYWGDHKLEDPFFHYFTRTYSTRTKRKELKAFSRYRYAVPYQIFSPLHMGQTLDLS